MPESTRTIIDELLTGAVDQLDLPAELQALAERIYEDIGLYLSDNLAGRQEWAFYPQGSARIGTGVPPDGSDEWDIDAVAEVDMDKESITQSQLKKLVGDALTRYAHDRADDARLAPAGIESGRRCWTLLYDGPFHVDVLPAVPNHDAPPTGIWLGDRALLRWQPSNPKAYADWFVTRMGQEFVNRRVELAKAASVEVDEIPSWRVKTTLQRAVQVLKLHRNSFFADNLDDRVPSCVITTLAALAYGGQTSLADALLAAAEDMPRHIHVDGETWMVSNPVQPGDNLADRWSTNREALRQFMPWLSDLAKTLEAARSTETGMDSVVAALSTRFDRSVLNRSMKQLATRETAARRAGELAVEGSGALVAGSQGAAAKRAQVRDHTFHGS
jgi:hypothetical protein